MNYFSAIRLTKINNIKFHKDVEKHNLTYFIED